MGTPKRGAVSPGVREAAIRKSALLMVGEVERMTPERKRYPRGRRSWLTPAEELAIMLHACRYGAKVVPVATAFGRDPATVRRLLRSPRFHAVHRRFMEYAIRLLLPMIRRPKRGGAGF